MKALLRIGFVALSAVVIAGACEAQTNQISDGDRIQQLLLRIDQLEASQKAMQEKIDSLQTTKPLAEPRSGADPRTCCRATPDARAGTG